MIFFAETALYLSEARKMSMIVKIEKSSILFFEPVKSGWKEGLMEKKPHFIPFYFQIVSSH